MNKAIRYTLLALAALCLFISCNIDSTEGLIQAAATAVNVIDYNTTNVIGRSGNALYVTTDKGICKIDSNGNYTVVKEGGNLAKKAIWANESEYAYFNSENNKYITEKYDGTAVSSTLFNEFDGYTLKSSFSNDGINFTLVFEKDGIYYRTTFVGGTPAQAPISVEEGYQLSIIGQDAFVLVTRDGKFPKIIVNGDIYNVNSANRISGAIKSNGVVYAVDIKGKVYSFAAPNSSEKEIGAIKLSSSAQSVYIPMALNSDGNILFIYPGDSSSNLITVTPEKTEIKNYSNSALASTIPHRIVGYNSITSQYLIINERNGAYNLNPGAGFTKVNSATPFNLNELI